MEQVSTSAPRWQPTAAGAHLSGRRSRDTEPELRLRRALFAAGLRYRLHQRLDKGCTPDLVLARHRLAVFVDGCFWHGCPQHGRTRFTGPNAGLWAEKMRRNRARDERATRRAEELGYRVIRVWECDVRDRLEHAVSEVLQYRLQKP
jgi:DNA mismatch endonuclease (patch repair protein)